LRRSQSSAKDVNNSNNNNINNNNNETNAKQKDKEKEKRVEHHKKEHKSSKESKQKSDKRDSKKRLHENSKDMIPSKKRSTDESKKSLISHNETKPNVFKSVDKLVKKTTTTPTPVVNPGVVVDPEVLIKALQELENSASADAGVRQKIASLPTEVFDATLLDKIRDKGAAERLTKLVDEARSLLADYNSRLAQELEDRKHISMILSNFTQNQRNALSLVEQKLNEYREKLRKVVQVRNELKSHLQNLPDLSRLPSVTGLAPLPSACDLFNVNRIVNSTGSVTSSVSPNESNASPVDYGTPGSNTSL
jgi:hypothetical protein